jgi:PD-(D/E)XK nuclease superfamily protein
VIPVTLTGLNTTAKGDIAEQAIVLALMAAGRTVLRPISNGLRYDLLIDNFDGTFTRVQCKTGMLKRAGTVLNFRAYNADARRPNGVPYHGQVDAFGVYCPNDGRVYFVPIAEIGSITSEVSLRQPTAGANQERSAERRALRGSVLARARKKTSRSGGLRLRAEDGIRTRDPVLGKHVRYRCATSAGGSKMISNSTSKGKTSDSVILAALVKIGKSVLIP